MTSTTNTDTTVKTPDTTVKTPDTTVKPATDTTVKPATDTATIAKLEAQATRHVNAGNKSGMALASILVDLYVRSAWESHDQSVVDYFTLTIGVGESGFTMGKSARQEVVKLMADAKPDAPIAHLAIITGASLRTISRDREQWELANPNRVNSHKPDGDDDATDDDTDATDDKPAKTSKTKVNVVNVLQIVDTMQDTQMLMSIMTHAGARLAELSAPATDKAAA